MNFKPLQNGKYSFLFRNDTSIDDIIENIIIIAKEHIRPISTDDDIVEKVEDAIYLVGLGSLIQNATNVELSYIYEKVSEDKIVPSFYALDCKNISKADWIDGEFKDRLVIIDADGKIDEQFDDFLIIKERLENNMDREEFDNAFPNFFDELIAFFKPIVIYKIKEGMS